METTMMRARYLTLVISAAAMLTVSPPASAVDQLKLTVGQRGNWDTAVPYLG